MKIKVVVRAACVSSSGKSRAVEHKRSSLTFSDLVISVPLG